MPKRSTTWFAFWLLLGNGALSCGAERWVRFDDQGVARYGLVDDDIVHVVDGEPWSGPVKTGRELPRANLRILTPTEPRIVLGAAYNYRSHLSGRPAPEQPQFFWKTPGSLIADGDPVVLPPDAHNAHYEAELVIVIGRPVSNATLEEARDAIFGYTCGNDVSERDWAQSDVQWWRAKATATFGPVGPEIVTGLDWRELRVRGFHNGALAQDQGAKDMFFGPPELIRFASRYVALSPGDLIFTASPGATKSLAPGDVYDVRIDGVGVLRNPVTRRE